MNAVIAVIRAPLERFVFLVPAAPAIAQAALLLYAVARRFTYPYDLEWMEGGMLGHAHRLAEGKTIYAPPSVEFIPQLYTPLYPALLALLGEVFGLSYQLGRAVSVTSMLVVMALAAWAVVREAPGGAAAPAGADARRRERDLAWGGAAAAVGLFAGTYPWVDCFYDLVRVDSLALALGLGGLVALRAWARRGPARVAAAAALLAVSFFAKQTGFLLVAAGGAALLVMNWRAVPVYVVVAGAIGGGGSWLLNTVSDGWYWTYVYRVHQYHDWNIDRFWASFGHVLGKYPIVTGLVGAGLLGTAAYALVRRRLPAGGGGLLFWAWFYAFGTVIGGIGYGTQWAVFNAFIPAMTFGAIAAGAAIVPLADAAGALVAWSRARAVAGGLLVAALGAQAAISLWLPRTLPPRACATPACAAQRKRIGECWSKKACVLLPSADDRAAGDRLIARLRQIEGEIFMPSHPWYARLAGKRPWVHRIGIKDMTWNPGPVEERRVSLSIGKPPKPIVFRLNRKEPLPPGAQDVRGLAEMLREKRFAAVVLDDAEPPADYPGLQVAYRIDAVLGRVDAPTTFSGKPTIPRHVYVPIARETPPPGTIARFDFEEGGFGGWEVDGVAWGTAPVAGALTGQAPVVGHGGRRFASSMHGGDRAMGTLISPPFRLERPRLALRVGGGDDATRLRVELRRADGGDVLRSATGPKSEVMRRIEWDVSELVGQEVRLALVDESEEPWGHLTVDEVWELAP